MATQAQTSKNPTLLNRIIQRARTAQLPLPPTSAKNRKKLLLARKGRRIAGVCQGISNLTTIPVVLIRIGVTVALLLAFPVAFVTYLVLWAAVPRAQKPTNRRIRPAAGIALEDEAVPASH